MTERTVLAQMLWDLKESGDGLSYTKMAARSGGLIAASTLHGVMHGKAKELPPDTVAGIARILRISEGHVLAALRGDEQPAAEQASEEQARLWEMYSDIPRQCQQDVLDLLAVLQRNHSVSARKGQRAGRRVAAVAAASGSQKAVGKMQSQQKPPPGRGRPVEVEPKEDEDVPQAESPELNDKDRGDQGEGEEEGRRNGTK